jgi:hypothetical protein
MTLPLAAFADAPLHPMRPDGPCPRALLMDPATGVSLRIVFRRGRIDLLAHAAGPGRRTGVDATWPNPAGHAAPGAALEPNWIRIGDLPDAGPLLPRDAAPDDLADRWRLALDHAVGPAAIRRADALAHAALSWSRRNGPREARSVLRGPQGAVLSLVPEGRLSLPGAAAFDRALALLRTSAPGRPVAPVARLQLPQTPPAAAHAALALAAHADALFAAAGMSDEDRSAYTP